MMSFLVSYCWTRHLFLLRYPKISHYFIEIMNTNQHVAEIVEKKENMKRFINQFIKFKSKFYNAYKIMATIQERLPEFLTMNDMKAMKSMMIGIKPYIIFYRRDSRSYQNF